ncbi:MAG: family protein phosphatase [Betaproteobacteria bacterium]|jgi:serine/threonine protein phosphatase PrpC|nr:family protein phosphatase [Betaproteobacteria bacterium]
MKFTLAQDTRIGNRRSNQDRIGHWRTPECLLLAVADGLGGHAYGEVAAQMAMEQLGAAFAQEAKPKLADPGAFLFRAMGGAHAAILREADKQRLDDTPRTVLVACVIQDGRACWTHVGDSRLYFLRQGRILHRTRDHTLVQQLIDEGRIREEAVATHPERNRLLQCIGGYQAPRPDPASNAPLEKGDVLVLCSDGFWGPLTQRHMLHSLLTRPLDKAIPELAELAEARSGGRSDNVSVLAMTWNEEALSEDRTPAGATDTEIRDLTATDMDYLRMTDEDVEKAIAELKTALRKNAPQ